MACRLARSIISVAGYRLIFSSIARRSGVISAGLAFLKGANPAFIQIDRAQNHLDIFKGKRVSSLPIITISDRIRV